MSAGAFTLVRSLAIFVHLLRHLEMMLQRRQGDAGSLLQRRIIAAVGIPLKQRDGVFVSADLHRIVRAREIFRLRIAQLVEFLLRAIVKRRRDCPISSPLLPRRLREGRRGEGRRKGKRQ
jgi:hypothetical protein